MGTTTTMHASNADAQSAPISKGRLWTGRIMSALPALFLLVDGVGKLVKPAPVVEGTVQLGYPESESSSSHARFSTRFRARPFSERFC
jgi:hypothetical protein